MNKSPAFQFYPQDFLVGTAMLSAEETGAYIRLLCYSWENDGLPNDEQLLSRLAGCSGNAVASIRHKFGICQDGKLRNERQEKIRKEQNAYRAQQKLKAKKRWKNTEKQQVSVPLDQSGICSGNATALPMDMPNGCPSPSIFNKDLSYDKSTPDKESGVVVKKNIVDAAWIEDLKRHYPTIDIDQELRNMDAWLAEHPNRRKTRRFIIGWLNRNADTLPKQPEREATEDDFTWD